jgi:streptomycin 6-kinase
MWLGEASDKTELPEAKILLADFGEAFSPTWDISWEWLPIETSNCFKCRFSVLFIQFLQAELALSAQLVLAVDYVHSQGFVHGDLHYGNVLLQLPFDHRNV